MRGLQSFKLRDKSLALSLALLKRAWLDIRVRWRCYSAYTQLENKRSVEFIRINTKLETLLKDMTKSILGCNIAKLQHASLIDSC